MLATLVYSAPLIWRPVRPTAGSEIASVGPSFEPSRSHLHQRSPGEKLYVIVDNVHAQTPRGARASFHRRCR